MKRFQALLAGLLVLGVVVLRWPGPQPPGRTLLCPPEACFALLPEGDSMWVGSWEGLFRGDPAGLTRVETGRRLQYVRALCRDRQGRLWVGHNGGLSCQAPDGSWSHESGPMVTALAEDPAGRLWVGSIAGLRLQGGAAVPLPGPEQRVSCLLVDRDGALWVGTGSSFSGGVYRRDARGVWSEQAGLPHPHVNCLAQDQAGTLWAGCGYLEDGGLVRLGEPALVVSGLPSPNVRALWLDGERQWIGFEFHGLVVRSGERIERIEGLPHQEVLALCPDRAGRVWIATRKGVLILAPEMTKVIAR